MFSVKRILVWVAVFAVIFAVVQLVRSSNSDKDYYSQMITQIDSGKVARVAMDPKNNQLKVYLTGSKDPSYETGYPNNAEPQLLASFKEHNVGVSVQDLSRPFIMTILSWLLPIIVILILWFFIMGQMGSSGLRQMNQFTKTKAERVDPENLHVTFDDVAGIDEAVEELREMKDFLQDPQKYLSLGARIPKGVLLSGPPGSGKTMLAKALANEAGVPFFSMSGSDIVELFVGVGASRVRSTFEDAKKVAPSVLFLDEIDAIGRQRGAGIGGGNDEKEASLNQLLVEMDGFNEHQNVLVVAATNRPDVLDPALLRPGRFDRQIVVSNPDKLGREQILRVHAKNKPLASDVDLKTISAHTAGFSGADLENLLNESALLAARRKGTEITQHDVDAALLRIVAGPEKKARILSDKEKKITAYHELGHAMVGHLLEHTDPVERISIIPRGRALGFTLSLPDEDQFLVDNHKLVDDMAMMLGGRAAEQIVFDSITTGASNDLERVTETAKQMIMRWGMSEKLGQRVFGHDHMQPFLGKGLQTEPDYSEEVAKQIDAEIKVLVDEAYERALVVLKDNRELLEHGAVVLLDKETLTRSEFRALMAGEEITGEDNESILFSHESDEQPPAAAVADPKPATPKQLPEVNTEGLESVKWDETEMSRGKNKSDDETQPEEKSTDDVQPAEESASPQDRLQQLRDLADGRARVIVRRDGAVLTSNAAALGNISWAEEIWADPTAFGAFELSTDEKLIKLPTRDA